jgi:CMP-2-keto-3-deoxyoctulosonic acid synthetase
MTAFTALIPARRARTRLPGKVLADLAVMTRADHPSGTDRLAETAQAPGLADDYGERGRRRTR